MLFNLKIVLGGSSFDSSLYSKSFSDSWVSQKCTSEDVWSGSKPDLNYMKVFGCKPMVLMYGAFLITLKHNGEKVAISKS